MTTRQWKLWEELNLWHWALVTLESKCGYSAFSGLALTDPHAPLWMRGIERRRKILNGEDAHSRQDMLSVTLACICDVERELRAL